MTAGVDVIADRLCADDRRLVAEEVARNALDSEIGEQLACVRVILRRLAERYAEELADYERRLDPKIESLDDWRASTLRKSEAELESPVPWMHPLKLAGEDLREIERSLDAALRAGETAARDPEAILGILDRHGIELPGFGFPREPRFPAGRTKRTGAATR